MGERHGSSKEGDRAETTILKVYSDNTNYYKLKPNIVFYEWRL